MSSFAAALEVGDSKLKSLVWEHYASYLYLMKDMSASLDAFG